MEISSGYLEQWWQNLYQRRWALPGVPFVWRACKLPSPNSSRRCHWEQTVLGPPLSTPRLPENHPKGLPERDLLCRLWPLDQSTGICLWNRSEGHQRSVSVPGTPSSTVMQFHPSTCFKYTFRKRWWGLTQDSEAVHQDVPIISSGLRHSPVSSVTANKWVKTWFSPPLVDPRALLRASHLRTSLPPTFQEIWNTSTSES